ncbi:hypothetical protein AK812_SmicGene26480 [Symbiodinium microadriaticum]|uniref:Uncharacterized protein n=1 Tax=Symbiodinium microadriaticum TaxID=2951 RepID=A0A1Q9D9E4_SYMMI|nr:hypothetical protein AK812_SmicGene26480 [Symbiodinium microadriaticum]
MPRARTIAAAFFDGSVGGRAAHDHGPPMAEAVKEDGFAPAARTYIGNAFLSWQEEEEVEVECEPLVMQVDKRKPKEPGHPPLPKKKPWREHSTACVASSEPFVGSSFAGDSSDRGGLHRHIDGLSQAQKDGFLSELADKPRTNDKPKKSTQDMMDVGLFLTQLDIEDLNRADLNWLAKITRLAVVFARVGCTNPRKDSCGRAVTFLKQTMTVSELSDPGTFLSSVQDFKTALKAAVKKGAACNCARGEVHYTGCLARRVSDELVAGASGQINPFRVKEELGSRMIMREHGSFDKAPCRIPEPQKLQTFLDGAGAVLGRVVLLVRDRPASRRCSFYDRGTCELASFSSPGLPARVEAYASFAGFSSTGSGGSSGVAGPEGVKFVSRAKWTPLVLNPPAPNEPCGLAGWRKYNRKKDPVEIEDEAITGRKEKLSKPDQRERHEEHVKQKLKQVEMERQMEAISPLFKRQKQDGKVAEDTEKEKDTKVEVQELESLERFKQEISVEYEEEAKDVVKVKDEKAKAKERKTEGKAKAKARRIGRLSADAFITMHSDWRFANRWMDSSAAPQCPEEIFLRQKYFGFQRMELVFEAVVDSRLTIPLRGLGCDGRLLSGRRLQQALHVDYLIVFPTSLGLEAAIVLAETSQKGLETVSVEATSTWLKEEVAQVEALQNLEVAVATKSVALSLSSEAQQLMPESTADGMAIRVVVGSVAILFPACLLVLSWRCGKRLVRSAAISQSADFKLAVEVYPEVDIQDIRRSSLMDDEDFRLSGGVEEAPNQDLECPALAIKPKRLVPKGRVAKKALAVAVLAETANEKTKRQKAKRLVPKQRKAKKQPEAIADATEPSEIQISFEPASQSEISRFDDDNLLEPPSSWLTDDEEEETEEMAISGALDLQPSPLESEREVSTRVNAESAPPKPKKVRKRAVARKAKKAAAAEGALFEGSEDEVVSAPSLPWEEFKDSSVNARAQFVANKDDPHETW